MLKTEHVSHHVMPASLAWEKLHSLCTATELCLFLFGVVMWLLLLRSPSADSVWTWLEEALPGGQRQAWHKSEALQLSPRNPQRTEMVYLMGHEVASGQNTLPGIFAPCQLLSSLLKFRVPAGLNLFFSPLSCFSHTNPVFTCRYEISFSNALLCVRVKRHANKPLYV